MIKTSLHLAVAAWAISLSACSQSSGIPQVDNARDTIASELGVGPELRPVGDAADRAARRAEAAGTTGDPATIATAIGKGAAEVGCAGLTMKKPAAQQAARTFETHVPNIEHKDEAIAAYRGFIDKLPDIPSPC